MSEPIRVFSKTNLFNLSYELDTFIKAYPLGNNEGQSEEMDERLDMNRRALQTAKDIIDYQVQFAEGDYPRCDPIEPESDDVKEGE